MPTLTIWAARASLLHLVAGFTFGGLILANKGVPLHPALWALLPAHIEFLLLGWIAQLALAVAFWILPRFRGRGSRSRAREFAKGRRGNVVLAWASVALLNAGVLLAGFGRLIGPGPPTLLLGRLLTAAAALTFALHAWPRVKPPGARRG